MTLWEELRELIEEDRARIIGAIRQELLSGIRQAADFERLRERLRAFPDESVTTADYERAAQFSNRSRASGIAGSPVDFVICSVAESRRWAVFTSDRDFEAYRKVLGVQLHSPRP
jgi:predicted nucleic acid-binding protein